MNELEENIKNIQSKLQLLIKKTTVLQKENDSLRSQSLQHLENEKGFKLKIDALQQKVSILQASAGKMTENDQKEFEKTISQHLKEIDKCINMLSE
ncbi:MAG: hypothetical protein H0W12_03630 [Chitinophagaceae bacterium]|nr:hypothetical protein [Chitinophagaceae bacterium]